MDNLYLTMSASEPSCTPAEVRVDLVDAGAVIAARGTLTLINVCLAVKA